MGIILSLINKFFDLVDKSEDNSKSFKLEFKPEDRIHQKVDDTYLSPLPPAPKRIDKPRNVDPLKLVFEYEGLPAEQKKASCRELIDKYKESSSSLDILAVAKAYDCLGATYRNQAISYYERFFANPVQIPYASYEQQNATLWIIHSNLAKLYEREYLWDKAIEQLQILIGLEQYGIMVVTDHCRIADILVKKCGTQKALDYLKAIENTLNMSEEAKDEFEDFYKEIEEKHNRGYVYRPRPQKHK